MKGENREKINWRNVFIILLVGTIGFALGVIISFNIARKHGVLIWP